MEIDERPRPKGDLASRLATEALDSYSQNELDARIVLLEAEIARVVAHREKAKAHRAAAEALFGRPAPAPEHAAPAHIDGPPPPGGRES